MGSVLLQVQCQCGSELDARWTARTSLQAKNRVHVGSFQFKPKLEVVNDRVWCHITSHGLGGFPCQWKQSSLVSTFARKHTRDPLKQRFQALHQVY
jgi:hypothetical protein